jgi:hypothetical protein
MCDQGNGGGYLDMAAQLDQPGLGTEVSDLGQKQAIVPYSYSQMTQEGNLVTMEAHKVVEIVT